MLGSTVACFGLFALFALLASSAPRPIDAHGLGGLEAVAQTVTGSGVCDTDGVNATYQTSYQRTPSRAYLVTTVVVNNIAWPSCNGATLMVRLTNAQNTVIGSNAVPVGGTPVNGSVKTPVPMSPQPNAQDVTGLSVTLSGGTTPIPPECSRMTFDNVVVGTTGNDPNLTGTSGNDLIYGLSGVDSISGLNGNDCLNGGPNVGDDDTITDGNGTSVVLAGDGTDQVTVGNGADLVKLGNGNDSVQVGNGSGTGSTVYLGTGKDTITAGNTNNTIYTGGRTGAPLASGSAQAVSITVGNGSNTIYLGNGAATVNAGNGNNTLYLGSTTGGSGTITLGKGTNTCHAPTLHPNNYTITNCKVVTP